MQKYDVVVVGGGATGVGILRDLAMRGIKALLVEQQDLAYGTSSRFHGLLHSGGRYAVGDQEAARHCMEENRILRKIGAYCVEPTEGFFVRTAEDSEEYEEQWVYDCNRAGIPVAPLTVAEARRLEPELSDGIQAAYRVPDAAIDGFRLIWQNVSSARSYGGAILTYAEVTAVESENRQVVGVEVRSRLTGATEKIACDMLVNAAGSWVGQVARLAGLTVSVKPDKGTLIAFNHRICSRVVNRLHQPADADIFVPHGTATILGTTSVAASRPDDFEPSEADVLKLLTLGKALFADLDKYRIIRAFAGTRPIYDPGGDGRSASRSFTIIDHAATDGLQGMLSIVGGKLTTYRLMAEKAADMVCGYLNVKAVCRTAEEPLVPTASSRVMAKAGQLLPTVGLERAVARLGTKFADVVQRIEQDQTRSQLVCECEMVTLAEVEAVAAENSSCTLNDVRRKTRIGMGTCQGAFCALRGAGVLNALAAEHGSAHALLKPFLADRWAGIRPVLWGNQVREAELTRAIYAAVLNIDGAMSDEE